MKKEEKTKNIRFEEWYKYDENNNIIHTKYY